MAVIEFLPDRLNSPPSVYRGFTTGEMGLAAGCGMVLGIPLALPFLGWVGWVAIPTGMLVMPLAVIFFGGRWMSRFKRGKPEHYLWRRLQVVRGRLGLACGLILTTRSWAMTRSRPVKRGGGV